MRVELCDMDTIERRFTHDGRARVLSRPSTTTTPAESWSMPDILFPPSSAGRKRGLPPSRVNLRGRRIGARSLFGRVSNAPSSGEGACGSGGGCAATEVYGRGGSGYSAARSGVEERFGLVKGVAGRCESGRPRARPAEDRPTTVAEAHSCITKASQPLTKPNRAVKSRRAKTAEQHAKRQHLGIGTVGTVFMLPGWLLGPPPAAARHKRKETRDGVGRGHYGIAEAARAGSIRGTPRLS